MIHEVQIPSNPPNQTTLDQTSPSGTYLTRNLTVIVDEVREVETFLHDD